MMILNILLIILATFIVIGVVAGRYTGSIIKAGLISMAAGLCLSILGLVIWQITEGVISDTAGYIGIGPVLIILFFLGLIIAAAGFGLGCAGGAIQRSQGSKVIRCPYCSTPRKEREAFCTSCGHLMFQTADKDYPFTINKGDDR